MKPGDRLSLGERCLPRQSHSKDEKDHAVLLAFRCIISDWKESYFLGGGASRRPDYPHLAIHKSVTVHSTRSDQLSSNVSTIG